MAIAKKARVEAARFAAGAILLDLALDEPLGFAGGQYVIVDTGVDLPGGKRAKRAYSIVTSDEAQSRITLAVKRLEGGPGSNAMHALGAGDAVTFSGPWGKMVVGEETRGRTLVFATDTGITAALGLVRERGFDRLRAQADLVWYVESQDYFLPFEFAEGFRIERAPLPVDRPQRAAHALSCLSGHYDSAFLSGDGRVVHAIADRLGPIAKVECFFNNPAKKAP